MLQMGASKPWGEAMRKITRGTPGETDKMSAAPLLEYFQTLLVGTEHYINICLKWPRKKTKNWVF